MQHPRRVRRVAEDDQIRVGTDPVGVQPETLVGAQHRPAHLMAGGPPGHLGFGELRMHDHHLASRKCARDKGEGVRSTGGGQQLPGLQAVPGG